MSAPFRRNHVYNVSLNRLIENRAQRIEWISSDAHRELCTLKGKPDADCQNYIRVFARISPERIMICGTNSYKPLCRYYTTPTTEAATAAAKVAVVDLAAAGGPAVAAQADDDADNDAVSSGSAEMPPAELNADSVVVDAADEPPKAVKPADVTPVMSNEIEAQGRCPYTPQHNSTYVYTG